MLLSADGSFDPDGDALSYEWSHDCVDGNLNDPTSQNPVLGLVEPGKGNAQSCVATLRVVEKELSTPLSATCSAQISAAPCPIDCFGTPFGTAELDQCGKCGGSNECFDCAGKPFGTARNDRCGVCGGDGQGCLGCQGVLVGHVVKEIQALNREQQRLIVRAVSKLRKITNRPRYARKQLTLANRLQANNSSLDTTVSAVMNQCSNQAFCVRQDKSAVIRDLVRGAGQLHNVLASLTNDLTRRRYRTYGKALRREGATVLRQLRQRAAAMPKTEDVCY